MPVRGKAEPKEKKAPVTKKPEEPKKETPKEEKPKAGTKVQKFIMEERARKYLKAMGVEDRINEVSNRTITSADGAKVDVAFIVFSKNGEKDEEVDNDFNVSTIKDILFNYHTVPEEVASANQFIIEVLPPTEGTNDPAILCFQEVS